MTTGDPALARLRQQVQTGTGWWHEKTAVDERTDDERDAMRLWWRATVYMSLMGWIPSAPRPVAPEPPPEPKPDTLLPISAAARIVGCSREVLAQHIRDGKVRRYQQGAGSRGYVNLAEVQQWQRTRPRFTGRHYVRHGKRRRTSHEAHP